MTERLYYGDAYISRFDARILERSEVGGRVAVVLDRTGFYPTSGGQPFDKGTINGTIVEDVFAREQDDAIVHVLAGEIDDDEVEATIDWPRRFDHMQQHTGQHILSQAFVRVAQADTLSFHLGMQSSTIDLSVENISMDEVREAELLANQIIWDNRQVRVSIVSRESADSLSLRRVPTVHDDELRLIEVSDFDISACGGTHVSSSGEIGLIKIVKLERQSQSQRVEFLCGRRALEDYRLKNDIITSLAGQFTTGFWELEHSIDRLRDELQQSQRQLKKQQKRLLALEAAEMFTNGAKIDDYTVVTEVLKGREVSELRVLANAIIGNSRSVALIGMAGNKSLLIFARSDDGPGDMRQLLQDALDVLGWTSGGGSAKFAQGGGRSASENQLREALVHAERLLRE